MPARRRRAVSAADAPRRITPPKIKRLFPALSRQEEPLKMVFPFFRAGPPPRLLLAELTRHRIGDYQELRSASFKPPCETRFLWRRNTLRPGRSPLLKTFTAINRPPLCWLERNRRFFSALRAYRLGFDTLHAAGTRCCARRAVGLARFAPLGLVFETLVGEKHLLAGGENELSRTLRTLQNPIVVFHTLLHSRAGTGVAAEQFTQSNVGTCPENSRFPHPDWLEPFEWTPVNGHLVLLTPLLFPETLTREGLFGTAPFTWFHVVAVLFYLLDYVFRLHLSLEASEGILQRFALLNDNFCHAYSPPFPVEC
jgi:hypothetical protein